MKKIIAVILAVSLLLCFSAAFAETNERGKTLNEAETAAVALSMFLGNPILIDSVRSSEYDMVNSRYIYMGNKEEVGYDLMVLIRISDEEVYAWGLDMTPENLVKAKLALDENAPVCALLYDAGNGQEEIAIYEKDYSAGFSYTDFMTDVDRIITLYSGGDMSAESYTEDPILACFPGLGWGMSKDEVMNTTDKDLFTELNAEGETSVYAMPDIYGKSVNVLFIFNDGKLGMFTAMVSEEDSDKYLDALSQAYGTPHKTTFMNALNGRIGTIKDDPDGDYYAWKTEKTLIMFNDTTIQYWPLY